MAEDFAAQLERTASGDHRPTTFLERGVAVPFTTPTLLGARLRPCARRGFELVINNISGGRGFSVVSWSSMAEICAPSLHDERLFALLSPLASIAPAEIRRAARQVAQEGWAGRAAAAAAAQAQSRGVLDSRRLNLRLLHRLVRQTEAPEEALPPIEQDDAEGQRRRAKRAILRAATETGLPADQMITGLEGIAEAFQAIGVPEEPTPPRLRGCLAEIEVMAREVAAWVAETPAAQELGMGEMLVESTALLRRCAAAMLARIDAQLADVPALLRRWQAAPEALIAEAGRPEWLLDGWPLLVGLWQGSSPADHLATSGEMALLAPLLPREAAEWCGIEADWDLPQRLRRQVKLRPAANSGRAVELVARNERLMARAL